MSPRLSVYWEGGVPDVQIKNDSHALDPGAVRDVHRLDDLAVERLCRAAHKQGLVAAGLVDILELLIQLFEARHRLFVDRDRSRLADFQNDHRPGRGRRYVGVGVLRQSYVDALLSGRRHQHEDDQQDQHDVDQGRDVDVRNRLRARCVMGVCRASSSSSAGACSIA